MSHHFKRPTSIDPKERRESRQIQLMAMSIPNQEALDILLEGSSVPMRAAMLDRIRPYLQFTPDEESLTVDVSTLDCPQCGMRRGSIIAHECLGSN